VSLSPKDDPRTWLLPGHREVKRPKLQARLLYYDLTKSQRALLRAMHEHAPEGALWEASLETYADVSGLSPRHIYNLIHGWVRNGRRTAGFLELGVLKCVRKAKRWPHPKPAAYDFNEYALCLRPKLLKRLEAGTQQTLPGIRHPGEPIEGDPDAPDRQPLPAIVGNRCHDDRQPLPPPSATVADDSKTSTSKTLIQQRERDSATVTPALSLDDERGIENEWDWSQRRGH
jgi:hypothetical protein